MNTALFLSPQIDDAVLSCGGTMARLARQGYRVVLATCFTASVPRPNASAQERQAEYGMPPEQDYMAVRRQEDHAAAAMLGVARVVHFPHRDAVHRGYDHRDALYGDLLPSDDADRRLWADLQRLFGEERPALVFAPQGLGGHVDHRQTIRALQGLRVPVPVAWYREATILLQRGDAQPAREAPALPWTLAVEVTSTLGQRLAAAASYASQTGYRFGGEARLYETLQYLAEAEGRRTGMGRPTEAFGAEDEQAVQRLHAAIMQDVSGQGQRRAEWTSASAFAHAA